MIFSHLLTKMKRKARVKRASAKSVKSSKRRARKVSGSKSKSKNAGRGLRKKKAKSKRVRVSSKSSSDSFMIEPMVQVSVKCVNCGREFSIVKLSGLSTEGMICQRCQVGEMQLPE